MSILWDFFTVLPARAGVILINEKFAKWQRGTTRTSGGDPCYGVLKNDGLEYYPHERG